MKRIGIAAALAGGVTFALVRVARGARTMHARCETMRERCNPAACGHEQ